MGGWVDQLSHYQKGRSARCVFNRAIKGIRLSWHAEAPNMNMQFSCGTAREIPCLRRGEVKAMKPEMISEQKERKACQLSLKSNTQLYPQLSQIGLVY